MAAPAGNMAAPAGDRDADPAGGAGHQRAVAQLRAQLRGLEASPVLPFTRSKFFLGIAKSYLTIYLAGRWPQHFWIWHALQYCLLLPLHVYRRSCTKGCAHFVEFCWVANTFLSMYLSALLIVPDVFDMQTRASMWHMLFAFGVGPLGGSVILLSNSLIPHSIDHTMSLLIHLSPSLTAYCLRWSPVVNASFFPNEPVSFGAYIQPSLFFLGTWAVLHSVFMLALGPRLLRAGHETTVAYNLKGQNVFTRVLGEVGDGKNETLRFFAYELISVALNAAILCLSYPLFVYGNELVHFALVAGTCCFSAWNGGTWYYRRFRKIAIALDEIDPPAKTNDKTAHIRALL